MKTIRILLQGLFPILLALLPAKLLAIPQSVGGPRFAANSPLNGQDLTHDLMAAALWSGDGALPGEWKEEGHVASVAISYLFARPKLLGREVVLLRATQRDGHLLTLDATFADAGSYFGFFDEKLPENLDRRAKRAEMQRRVASRQADFSRLYTDTLNSLRDQLAKTAGTAQPRKAKVGHGRTLRAEVQDYRAGDLTLRLFAADQRLIRLTIARSNEMSDAWLDPEIAALPPRDRLLRLQQSVVHAPDGTVCIKSLQPVEQGYRPYCGLNALAMVARYFGLHVDEDWLAVAGGFKNTGSADGSEILKLYPAVAAEAGFAVERSSHFDEAAVCRALAAGFPVVVWRRFSQERNQLHTRFAQTLAKDPTATLPDPAQPAERASWPAADAPLHASVLTGYNRERHEFLFLESWTGHDTPRRMRAEELAATSYLAFTFHP